MFLDRNLGDDLMLYLLSLYFENSENVFYVDCPIELEEHYNSLLSDSKCIKLIHCPLRSITNHYPRDFFKCIVQIGGSILMGNTLKGCWYRFLNCMLFHNLNKRGIPYIIIGCNIGPFRYFLAELFVRLEIKSAKYISTRDNASYNYIKKYSHNSKIRRFSDLVFTIPQYISKNRLENSIGIAVYGLCNDLLLNFLSQLSLTYLNQGGKIFLFCFNAGKQNDLFVAQSVKNKSDIYIVSYDGNLPRFLNAFSLCERILAIRFHAAILAEHFKIPYISISYNNKMQNFMSDNGNIAKDIPLDNIQKTTADRVLDLLLKEPVIPHPENFLDAKCHYDFLQSVIMNEIKETHKG